jgi:eukaryotic-like serine/threonine-protein kinase
VVASGDVLNGRYHLGTQVGRGAFARVYLGTDQSLKRQVAVKVLNPELTQDRTFLARFAEEAQHVAALEHQNILSVYDYGTVEDTAFLVMPYVAGGTLRDKLDRMGRLTLQEANDYLGQAAAGLDYAHAHNIVHRDVKPENMLLRDDGRLLLADFGVAKVLKETRMSSSRSAAGTPYYMAPEAWKGQVGRATDVYALGCMLFEMLAGSTPYSGSIEQLLYSHTQAAIPSLVDRSGDHRLAGLQVVIERALAKDPLDRFTSAGELAAAVQTFSQGKRVVLPPTEREIKTIRVRKRNLWVYLAAALMGMLVVACIIASVIAASRANAGQASTPSSATIIVGLGATPTIPLVAIAPTQTSIAPTATTMVAITPTIVPTVAPTFTPMPTPTRVPPTLTPVPPTSTPTPIPPTATSVPPTATSDPPTPVPAPTTVPTATATAFFDDVGRLCTSGPEWTRPAGVQVPECVRWRIPGGRTTMLTLTWTSDKISIANISGLGVGIWTDYQGTTLTVRYPDGHECRGVVSFELTIPGTYVVSISPQSGRQSVEFWQGEVQQFRPACR